MLDGMSVSAAFDNTMDMGIVGTTAGTLWYISWSDNSGIRLVSGHKTKVLVCTLENQNKKCQMCYPWLHVWKNYCSIIVKCVQNKSISVFNQKTLPYQPHQPWLTKTSWNVNCKLLYNFYGDNSQFSCRYTVRTLLQITSLTKECFVFRFINHRCRLLN